MARTKNNQKNNNGAKLGFEETLWLAADKQRGHMDAAEYKHVVLGLIFLKYISDAFSEGQPGSQKRISLVAQDIVEHFENRLSSLDGKAMIVCMSRKICVDLYNEIIKLRPDWHHPDDDKGTIKVVMTGSAADEQPLQPHIRSKARRKELAKRFKNPADEMKLVIVRDMWLTGFDAPCLHTIYIDKPMRGHGLMQAIAQRADAKGVSPESTASSKINPVAWW